jgi:hypothetical protein
MNLRTSNGLPSNRSFRTSPVAFPVLATAGVCHRARRRRDPVAGVGRPMCCLTGCLICPTGKSLKVCPAPLRKIFLLAPDPTRIYIACIPLHPEGRFANVTDVGAGCGGRSGARDGRCCYGRPSRVVLTSRRWCQAGGSNSVGDGGKRARSPGRARSKP